MSRAAEAAIAASYKALKEDFVSNLTGGEISEINYVTAVAPAAAILWSVLQARQHFFKTQSPISITVDFLLNVCAILLATTLYAKTPLLLNLLLLAPVPIIFFLPRPSAPKKQKVPTSKGKDEAQNPLPKKSFLTTYRGAMLVVTCMAILAVDFRIFPRRFAKVENWGTSLMDVGVGSFVFSAGVVAARPILKEKNAGKTTPLSTRLYRSLRHSAPLIVLGFIRLWSVKGLDYAEHVTEYGVHWNFFFTMGFLPPFLAIFQSAYQVLPSFSGLAIILAALYQAALEFTDLKAFILTAPRTNLFDKNREGIFSFFGYLAIFLAGQDLGMLVLPRNHVLSKGCTPAQTRQRLLLLLGGASAAWIVLFSVLNSYSYGLGMSVSRRLANMPYVLWIAAFNTTQITAFCLVESLFFPQPKTASTTAKEEDEAYKFSTSRVLDAFNRNGLFVFLIANLLTGLVNLTLNTLEMGDVEAMGVLVGYAVVITAVAVGLDWWDVSIKM